MFHWKKRNLRKKTKIYVKGFDPFEFFKYYIIASIWMIAYTVLFILRLGTIYRIFLKFVKDLSDIVTNLVLKCNFPTFNNFLDEKYIYEK